MGKDRKRRKSKASAGGAGGGGAAAGAASDDEEDTFFAGLAVQGALPKFAEQLKFRSLSVGARLWGCVAAVGARELTVALPHGLTGRVAAAEASDALADGAAPASPAAGKRKARGGDGGGGAAAADADAAPALGDLFAVGQMVRCTVVALRGGAAAAPAPGAKAPRRRVDLSLRVARANAGLRPDALRAGFALPASVASAEDHGYLLDFGIAGAPRAFLPRGDAPPGAPLRRGALVEVLLRDGAAGGAGGAPPRATAAPAAVAAALAAEWPGLDLGALQPGALVAARVRARLSDGLLLSFLTFFTGTVDPFHVGGGGAPPAEGARVRARVLYVDPATKRVGLSLAPHLVAGGPAPALPPPGALFEGAAVLRVDPGLGLLLDLEPGAAPPGPRGYAHVSNLAEGRVDKVEARFRPGQLVRTRVLGARPVDGLAAVSLRPGAVDGGGAGAGDLVPGARLGATVVEASAAGAVLQLGPGLRASVPPAHLSDVPSARAHKKLHAGQRVEARILTVDASGRRATATLKPALVGSKLPALARLEDAAVGARAHGAVTGVQPYGVFVAFYGGVAGLARAEELGLAPGQAPADAFAVGQVVKARVLGADAARGALRLSLAPKRGADKGAAAAGDASGFQPGDFARAVVVAAHAAAEGAAARFDVALLPLAEGEEGGGASGPIDVPVDAPRARLEAPHLSDAPAAAAALAEAAGPGADLGRVLVLERAPPAAGAPPGAPPRLRVTRKAALLAAAAAGRLPAALAELREGQVAPGFVASVTADAVFVRFLGGLTGRAGLAQLADAFVADPAALFAPGQTVRARVAGVDAEKGRFGLALKHGATAGGDGGAGAAALLAAALADAELAARLAAAREAAERGGAAGAPPDWAAALAVGALALGEVSEERAYGLVCDLAAHPDVVGLAAPHQAPAAGAPAPGAPAPGAPVRAAVLDVSRRDGVVDLSLRPELVARAEAAAAAAGGEAAPAKRRRGAKAADAPAAPPLEVGAAVRVVVELVKPEEGYCVVSLPEGGSPGGPFLAFLPTADLNLQRSAAPARAPGDAVSAVVAALPSAATGGRLLLAAPLGAAEGAAAAAAAAAPAGEERPKGALPARGALVRGRVEAVHALHADVVLADGHRGRLHVSEAPGAAAGLAAPGAPAPAEGAPSPLAALAPGAELELVVLGRMPSAEGRRHGLLELSARAEALAGAGAGAAPPRPLAWADLVPGAALRGYVQEAAPATGHLWIAFGPAVRGRAFLPAGRADAAAVAAAARALCPGAPVAAVVLAADAGRRALDVSLGAGPPRPAPAPGATALGVVTAVSGAGVRVQVGAAAAGRVALTDVHDAPVADALAGLAPRQVVRVAVLARGSGSGGGGGGGEAGLLALSLRPSRGGEAAAHAAAPAAPPGAPAPPEALAPADLAPGRRVTGYVRAAGRAGVFVALARGLDARVRLRQLADGFVDDPAAAFPEGRRVEGTVLKVEGGRVELTLKARRPPPSLEGLEPGRAVRGRVRRVEPFGVFVELRGGGGAPGGGPVGLAHVSELADGFCKDPAALFAVGQAVLGRVLSVDRAAGRLALTLKPSLAAGAAEEASGSESEGGGCADFDEELAAAAGAESGGEEAEGGSEEEEEGEEEGAGAGAGGGFDLDADLLAAAAGGSESN